MFWQLCLSTCFLSVYPVLVLWYYIVYLANAAFTASICARRSPKTGPSRSASSVWLLRSPSRSIYICEAAPLVSLSVIAAASETVGVGCFSYSRVLLKLNAWPRLEFKLGTLTKPTNPFCSTFLSLVGNFFNLNDFDCIMHALISGGVEPLRLDNTTSAFLINA